MIFYFIVTTERNDLKWCIYSACNDSNQDGASSSGAFPYSHTSQSYTSSVLNSADNDHFLDEKITGGLFRRTTSVAKKNSKNYGERDDDIHVCVSCLRAIMNNKVNISLQKFLKHTKDVILKSVIVEYDSSCEVQVW